MSEVFECCCELWKKTPCKTSKQLKAGVMVSMHTLRWTLNHKGLYERRPRRTPLLEKKDPLIFAIEYLDKPQPANVLLTDKTKIVFWKCTPAIGL